MKAVAGDISFGSLQVARQVRSDHPNLALVQFDAHRLPFEDEAFRQVLAGGELLNHVDYPVVLRELSRIVSVGGILMVQFGAKWCLDSLWAIADAFLGNRIGYLIDRQQAKAFFEGNGADAEVTWGIAPNGVLTVKLLVVRNVLKALSQAGFAIEQVRSTNCLSGAIPLPVQQGRRNSLLTWILKALLGVDRIVGRVFPFSASSGNVFLLCRRLEA